MNRVAPLAGGNPSGGDGGFITATPVLLPGNMCDGGLWTAQVRAALPGAVDADLTRDDSIAAMAERTLAATTGRLLPIGFSMGAIVAVEMAVQALDRIAGLVLVGYNATADLPERSSHRPVQQDEVRAGGLERVLVEELKPNYLAAANRGDTALLDRLRDMGMGLGADVFIRQSEALRLRKDRRAAIAALRVPVLYLCGSEDTLCPPAWHRAWAAQTPHADFVEIAGAGHMLPLEAPTGFAETVAYWIREKGFLAR
jgi:pimeloyl-ACP methyl ester carboxylesterase